MLCFLFIVLFKSICDIFCHKKDRLFIYLLNVIWNIYWCFCQLKYKLYFGLCSNQTKNWSPKNKISHMIKTLNLEWWPKIFQLLLILILYQKLLRHFYYCFFLPGCKHVYILITLVNLCYINDIKLLKVNEKLMMMEKPMDFFF